jgi:hypothetical protein
MSNTNTTQLQDQVETLSESDNVSLESDTLSFMDDIQDLEQLRDRMDGLQSMCALNKDHHEENSLEIENLKSTLKRLVRENQKVESMIALFLVGLFFFLGFITLNK